MRFALDPLPRSISLKSLAILVAILVGGTALSVRQYLQSGSPHPRPRLSPASVFAQDACPKETAACPAGPSRSAETAPPSESVQADVEPAEMRPLQPPAASAQAPSAWTGESG